MQFYVGRSQMKGKRESRSVALNPMARDAMRKWLEQLLAVFIKQKSTAVNSAPRAIPEPIRELSVFCVPDNFQWRKPITQQHFRRLLQQACRACRPPVRGRLSSHSMRKTFARAIHKALGNDLVQTKTALGHSRIETTLRYLESSREAIDQAVMNL